MAGSVNKAILIGNVGKDPEIRRTQDGKRIANLSVATEESWKDKQTGERKSKTEWHRVVCFNDALSDVIEKYVRKGSKLYLEGSLQTRKWTDQAGVEKYSTEIVLQAYNGVLTMLDGPAPKPDGDLGPGLKHSGRDNLKQDSMALGGGGKPLSGREIDDEIPF